MEARFSEQLRQAIRECPMSRYEISRQTGIAQSTLSKFVQGERGLSMASIDQLIACLGLELKRKDSSREG